MISIDEAAALRPEEKDAILDAVLGMAWTDGEVHPEELDLLRKLACHLTDRDVRELLERYQPDLERVGRKIARSDLGPAGRKILIRGMAYVAAASGNVTEEERAFYRQCLLAFGVPESQRQKIEAQVRQSIYAEFLRKRLREAPPPERPLDEAARRDLEARRRDLEIDEEQARALEAEVRRELV